MGGLVANREDETLNVNDFGTPGYDEERFATGL